MSEKTEVLRRIALDNLSWRTRQNNKQNTVHIGENEMNEKVLKIGELVFFESKTQNLGTAEFDFCPIWKRGRIVELFIYPRQQENQKFFYRVKNLNGDSLMISSWTSRGIKEPRAWLYCYCKEHKTTRMSVYVPENSNCFSVDSGLTVSVNFGWSKELK